MAPPNADVVVFESDRFSLDCTVADGHTYDLPLGDDVARHLAAELKVRDPTIKVDGPVLDDCWCTLFVELDQQGYHVSVNWLATKELENLWALQFSQPRGCLAAIFGKRIAAHSCCLPIMERIATIIQSDPTTFRNASWLSDEEFRRSY